MLRHLGYVAIALSIDATTNRTCRLRNATPERLRELIRLNLEGLYRVLQFNVQNKIFLYRISSQIIPFASHPVNRIPWWEEYAGLFDLMAEYIARHRLRVSMHPGRFTVLNSVDANVVSASVDELRWHARLLDCLRTDGSNKIVVHVGGASGGKSEAKDRFVAVANSLPAELRRRLIVENDERIFSVEDVLEVAGRAHLPVAFDWLHHQANPGTDGDVTELLARCFSTWKPEDGVPKVHFSSQAPGSRPGKHADWADTREFVSFLDVVPGRTFDCMLETRCKELALFRLRRSLAGRGVVEGAAA